MATERERWLELRRQGIGGSDVASVCSLPGAFATPYEVWLDKKGLLPPRESDEMAWGTLLEPVVAAAYERATGRRLTEFAPGTVFRHPEHPWVMATPDRLVAGEPGLAELKTARSDAPKVRDRPETGWGEEGTDEVPVVYLAQAQWQMFAANGAYRWVDVPVLIAGSDFRPGYRVPADAEWQRRLFAAAMRFKEDYLDADRPPPIDYAHPDAARLLDLLHRPRPGRVVEAGPAEAWAVAEWEEAGEELRRAEARRKGLQARLADWMKDAEVARLPDGRELVRKLITLEEKQVARAASQHVRTYIRKGR